MTSVQIKSEIQKVLEQVPENVLQDILDFVKELPKKSADEVRLANNIRKIISEDKILLQKLAQ